MQIQGNVNAIYRLGIVRLVTRWAGAELLGRYSV